MKRVAFAIIITFSVILYGLTIRGHLGNPTPYEIEYEQSTNGQPFETSQERSRWAMILSMVHNHTFTIDSYASMGTPDIGQINGHYYSFFPPGASILAIPLYLLGSSVGAAQLWVFSLSTLFALLTMLLIAAFTDRVGLDWPRMTLAALAFGFATNAWGYSVTLYAHLISGFFILAGVYLTAFNRSIKSSLLFWLCYSLAVYIDFPNLFIFLPLAVVQGFRSFTWLKTKTTFELSLHWGHFLAPMLFVVLMLGYGYYNYVQFGSPTRLSNTIPRVKDLKEVINANPEEGREAVGALQTRNMLEGFRSFIISHDRGILIYTPFSLLSIFGLGFLQRKQKSTEVLLLTVPLTCLVLYTMFGDPYGGWAFGSRYLIAVMPELCILAVLGLVKLHRWWAKLGYSLVFLYSAGVSLLAPLTTNVIPPYVEARYLNLASDYRINISMLNADELNSFVYNHLLLKAIPGWGYYGAVFSIIAAVGLFCIWWPSVKATKHS